jgi:ligand-binding sensor domain-containing protein
MSRFAAQMFLVLLGVSSTLMGQQGSLDFGRWKNFTDMKAVRSVAAGRDSVWAATAGGLFLYSTSTAHFSKFTNSEGLNSNDLTAVTIDGAGRVWVGASDGSLNMYDPSSHLWKSIDAIKKSNRTQKGIRTLFAEGDSLLVGTDFGIAVYVMTRSEFGDTYGNFGFPTQAKVNDLIVYKNRIWAATDLGVASASLDAPNLSSPTSWTKYQTFDGLPAQFVSSVTAFRDTIIVGTSDGTAVFDGSAFTPDGSASGKAIIALQARSQDFLILWNDAQGYTIASRSSAFGGTIPLASNLEGQAADIALEPESSTLWVGTAFRGLARWTGTAWGYEVPNGPQSNLFSSILVDGNGVLWGASGISGRGQGFYRYDRGATEGEQWKNFTVSQYPQMLTNDYYKVSLGANGSLWVSSWGRGVVEVVGDSITRRLDQTTVPALASSVAQDSSYAVIGGAAADSKGMTWIVNRTAVNGHHLAELGGGDAVQYRTSPSDGVFTNIVIDGNDTKWLANSEPTIKYSTGLYYFNEDSIVTGTRFSGGWGSMTSSDGLPTGTNNTILSLAVDLDGDVCAGTDIGMMIITDPLNPKVASSRTSPLPLRGQVIQAIAVDAVNNKWVGTKEGVIVVTPDGTQLLGQYTVLSTDGRLVDDDVRSIAIDQQRGIVYIGTEKGLSSLEIAPVQAARSYSSLELGPNPYMIPNDQPLTIRNLTQGSSIKILAVDGSLILEFSAQGGGRAFWDGKDSRGRLVPSGVYFVVAFADNGNQITTGKLAVVRR